MAQKLKVAAKPTFSAPVVLHLAGDDGEAVEGLRFKAVFRRLKGTEAQEIQDQLDARTLKDRDLVDQVLVGWEGLEDEDGLPFAFNDENRETAREEWPTMEAAIVFSWFKHQDAATVKN